MPKDQDYFNFPKKNSFSIDIFFVNLVNCVIKVAGPCICLKQPVLGASHRTTYTALTDLQCKSTTSPYCSLRICFILSELQSREPIGWEQGWYVDLLLSSPAAQPAAYLRDFPSFLDFLIILQIKGIDEYCSARRAR